MDHPNFIVEDLVWGRLHMCSKVDMLDSLINLIHTPLFEWYYVKCDSKNGYQKTHV